MATAMADIEVFEVLIREHESMLQAYLLGLVKDPVLAEELGQETFIRAYRKLSTLKKKAAFASWLRSIARNLAFSEIKRRGREVPTDPDVLAGMEDVFQALSKRRGADTWEERVVIVRECFDKLPETLRKVSQLHYMNDKHTKDIAHTLSVTLSSVLKRLERARNAIRDCVDKNLKLAEN